MAGVSANILVLRMLSMTEPAGQLRTAEAGGFGPDDEWSALHRPQKVHPPGKHSASMTKDPVV